MSKGPDKKIIEMINIENAVVRCFYCDYTNIIKALN